MDNKKMINYKKLSITLIIIVLHWNSYNLYSQYKLNQHLFTENKGQVPNSTIDDKILFYSHFNNTTIFFKENGISFVFYKLSKIQESNDKHQIKSNLQNLQTESIDFLFVNSLTPSIEAIEENSHHLNFYYPHCTDGITSIKQYRKLIYKNIYNSIDFIFYCDNPNSLKYDIVLHPGGNFNDIQNLFSKNLHFVTNNESIIVGELGEMVFNFPNISSLNTINKNHNDLISHNTLNNLYTNHTDSDIILSPEIRWSTYFGGEDGDHATGIVYDLERKIVVSGYTLSRAFPVTTNAEQKNRAGFYDGFIAKFDDNGVLQWATYFGGEETDYTEGLCSDNSNNIYICGYTWSKQLPVTPGAHQVFFAGGQNDGFIASFDKFGKRRWATYYGGSLEEHVYDVASNGRNELAIVGRTKSGNLYISDFANRRNPSMNDDAFIARFNLDGSFQWATYWGGDGDDVARAITYDKLGNIILTGFTNSPNFPLADTQQGDMTLPQSFVIFITKFDLSQMFHYPYSRLYGGSRRDESWAITLDSKENIYLAGFTLSSDFPLVANPLQSSYAGSDDAFLMKLNPSGRILWSTYIGGLKEEIGTALVVDPYDNIIITGRTNSENIRIGSNFPDSKNNGNYDIFLAKLNSDGRQVLMFDYFGGSSHEWVWGIAHETIGAGFYICGATESNNFPIFGNSHQTQNKGLADAIIVKLCGSMPKPNIQIIGKTRFCEGDSVILRASDGFTRYYWSTGARTQQITVRRTGDYYVEVMDSLGCNGKSQTVYVVVLTPQPPEIIGNLGFCPNDSTYIEVKKNYVNYQWSTGQKTKGITINKAGSYSVTITDSNGCRASTSFKIIEYPLPTPHILGPKTVCAFSNDIIYRLNAYPWECYIWEVEGGAMEYDVDSINISVDWGEGGPGKVIVKAINKDTGCFSFDTMHVKISDKLEPKITSNTGKLEFCEGDSIIIDAGSEYFSYIWSTGETEPEITIKSPGKYWLIVKDAYNCSGTDTVEIIMHPLPETQIIGEFDICEFSTNIVYETPLLTNHSYSWTVENAEIVEGEFEHKLIVNLKNAGTSYITLNVLNEITGCLSISEPQPINIHSLPKAYIIAPIKEFCEGDSIQIELNTEFKDVLWNNGAKTPQIWIKSPGQYFAFVTNEFNCSAYSDTIEIIMHSKPAKPTIIRNNDILTVNSNDICQWYFNDTPIDGAVTNNIRALKSGFYKVKVTNQFGCYEYSDNFPFERGYAKITIQPDTIFANIGEKVKIPIVIVESSNLFKAGANKFNAMLSFNSTILYPAKNQEIIRIDDTTNIIKFTGNLIDTLGILAQIEFTTALGEVPCSELVLDSISWFDAPVDTEIGTSYLCLADLCYTNDKVRLLSFRENFELLQNIPNPFSHTTEIMFKTIESGLTTIELFDYLGRKVTTIFEDTIPAGEYKVIFDSAELSAGMYYYTLRTPTMFSLKKMQIMK